MARRAASGEGTIYPRKDGRWEGAAYCFTASGIRKRVRVYGQTRSEVHRKLLDLKAKQQQGIPVADKSWRLGEFLDYWLAEAVRPRRRPLTYRRSEAVVRLHLKPGLEKYSLESLSVQLVQRFFDRLYASGISAASVFQIRKVLSAALTYAVRTELLFRNVARLVELPTYKPAEAAHWSADQLLRFLQAAQSDPLRIMFTLLALYGLRSGEVRGLRWCDVDFVQGELRVRQQVQRIAGVLQEVPLKTQASRRDEPLLQTARQALLEHRAVQATARTDAGDDWQGPGDDTELVFTTNSGRPIEARNLFRSFRRICEKLDLPQITLHGIRHSNATAQKELAVHARDTQAILGHGDVRTTGIYEHVGMASKREALEKVEQRLFAVDGSGRSRQLPSNCHNVVHRTTLRASQRKHSPLWVSAFLGGSSQTRTGDTRLFRTIELTLDGRITEVRRSFKRAERQWMLGAVAVNLAVRVTEI